MKVILNILWENVTQIGSEITTKKKQFKKISKIKVLIIWYDNN